MWRDVKTHDPSMDLFQVASSCPFALCFFSFKRRKLRVSRLQEKDRKNTSVRYGLQISLGYPIDMKILRVEIKPLDDKWSSWRNRMKEKTWNWLFQLFLWFLCPDTEGLRSSGLGNRELRWHSLLSSDAIDASWDMSEHCKTPRLFAFLRISRAPKESVSLTVFIGLAAVLWKVCFLLHLVRESEQHLSLKVASHTHDSRFTQDPS